MEMFSTPTQDIIEYIIVARAAFIERDFSLVSSRLRQAEAIRSTHQIKNDDIDACISQMWEAIEEQESSS